MEAQSTIAAPGEAAPADKAPTAKLCLWSATAVAILVGAVGPSLSDAGKFSQGYFCGNDYPAQAVLPTLGLAALLLVFAVINRVFRHGVGWWHFVLAFIVHLGAVAGGLGLLHWTFWSMIDRSVERAQRTVQAIHEFEAKRGRAPVGLKELTPQFLTDDPSLLFEGGPGLYYELDHPSLNPAVGAWTIHRNYLEQIRLEYAPARPGRALEPDEFRKGDWIVSVSNPCLF